MVFDTFENQLSACMILLVVPLLLSAALLYFVTTKAISTEDVIEATCQLLKLPRLVRGKKVLPCVPFRWPNGQGTEKFFGGRDAARHWRSQYGSLYSIWSGFKREIVITNPTQVKTFYKDSHAHIKSSDNNAGWLFAELLGECVGVVSRRRWKRVREQFDAHFTRSVSADRIGMFISEAKDFLNSLDCSNYGLIIDPANDMKYCPLFMVASIFFGPLTPKQRQRLYEIGPPREELFRETFMGGINRFKITKYLPSSALSRLRNFQAEWEQFVRDASQKADIQQSGVIISLWRAIQNRTLSMRELLHTLDESLFANLDVTTHAVAWNILRLAQHRDIQQMVWLELNECAAESEKFENYLCKGDTLLTACVLEASRLHPVLPFSNPEAAEDDKLVDGYTIPGKTDVIVDTYAINVENSYWHNPQEYDPYRHLGPKDQARRYNMWRFGFGPRQCLGKHVADIILRVIIAELLKRYEIILEEETGKDAVHLQIDSWIGLPSGRVRLLPRTN